jgi:plasmid stabilization system protein ParE
LKRAILLLGAKADFEEAARYFKAKKPSLSDAFTEEFHKALRFICRHPLAARKFFGDFRKRRVERFKFDIVYIPESEVVTVVAVMHQRRNPDYWKSRI